MTRKCLPTDLLPKGSESMPKHDATDEPKVHDHSIKDLQNDLKGRMKEVLKFRLKKNVARPSKGMQEPNLVQ